MLTMPWGDSGHVGLAGLSDPGEGLERHRRAAVQMFWILVLAIAIRGTAWYHFDPVTFDSAYYFEMADRIRVGRWSEALAYPYPPLFPALIAGVQRLGVSAETAGLMIALTADLSVLFPLFAIARIAFAEAAGLWAAFLWAVHPYAVRLGVQALADAPTAFFVAIAVWMGLRALQDGRMVWALGAGAASGAGYLVRPEGIEPTLAFALFCFRHGEAATPSRTLHPRSSAFGKRALRNVAWAVAPIAGWALLASPYVTYISKEAGSLTLSKKKSASSFIRSLTSPRSSSEKRELDKFDSPPMGGEAAAALTRDAHEHRGSTQATAGKDAGGSFIATPPVYAQVGQMPSQSWLRRMMWSAYTFQKPLVNGMNPLIVLLGFMGAWRARSSRGEGRSRARAILGVLLGLHLMVLFGLAADHGPDYLSGHHFFLMTLYALPFAGAGLAWALSGASELLGAPRWLPILALILPVAATIIWLVTRNPDRGVTVRPAAAWIRTQVVGPPVIVTNIAKLTYHAGAERVEPGGGYDDVIRRGRARSAHFMAFYPDMMQQSSPEFLARVDPLDLELVMTFYEPSRSAPDQRLQIYRFRPK